MEQTTKDKLAINVANSWKMLSVQFMAAVGALWTAYVSLPAQCAPDAAACISQAWVLAQLGKLPIPAPVLTLGLFLLGYYLRVKPQKDITPEVAAAKSTEAPQPPTSTVEFPMETGPAPLPRIDRGDTHL